MRMTVPQIAASRTRRAVKDLLAAAHSTLPDKVTRSLFGGLRYARLSVSGRNLLRFTGYPGLDPEVSNFGNQAIVRNIDVAPFPPNKSVFFGVDLGF